MQAIIDLAHAAGRYHKTLTNIRATTQAFIKFCRKKKVTILFPENLVIPRNAPKKEKHIAGPEDIRKLFTLSTTYWHLAERPDWYIHAYRFAVLTGLRPGELLGLRWSDVTDERITIRRSYNDDGELTSGKNENAHRTLALQGLAQQELEAQRDMLHFNPRAPCGARQQKYTKLLYTLLRQKAILRQFHAKRRLLKHFSTYKYRNTFLICSANRMGKICTLPLRTTRSLDLPEGMSACSQSARFCFRTFFPSSKTADYPAPDP